MKNDNWIIIGHDFCSNIHLNRNSFISLHSRAHDKQNSQWDLDKPCSPEKGEKNAQSVSLMVFMCKQ